MRFRKQAGFSLIEVMVVVVIIGILATVVVLNVSGTPDEARRVKAQQDIKALEAALEMYKLHNFDYPSTDQGLQALVSPPADAANWQSGGYLKGGLPKDPWGREYQYLRPGVHGEYDLWTYGRDGQLGGDGPDSDLGNWSG